MTLLTLAHSLLLPKMKFIHVLCPKKSWVHYRVKKTSTAEICPKCATLSQSVDDRRLSTVKDAPVRSQIVYLKILKRPFWREPCGLPLTEPVQGILMAKSL